MLCRVSPFGNLRIDAYVPLPVAYRSLSRPSSAPDAKAFPLRSFQLDLVAQALLAPCHVRVGRSSAPASRPLAKCRWASPSLFLPCGPVHRSLCVYAHVSGSQELCRHNLTEESSAFVAFTLLKFPQRAVTFALGALLAVLSLSLAKMPLSFAQPVFWPRSAPSPAARLRSRFVLLLLALTFLECFSSLFSFQGATLWSLVETRYKSSIS